MEFVSFKGSNDWCCVTWSKISISAYFLNAAEDENHSYLTDNQA